MAINKITFSIKGKTIIPLVDNKPYKKLTTLEDYSLFLEHVFTLSNIKYQSITISTYRYSCSDGCCDDEGYRAIIDDEIFEVSDEFDSLVVALRNFYGLDFEVIVNLN